MKIDLDWIQKELDAGREVELECVDELGLLSNHKNANKELLRSGLFVGGVDNDAIYVNNCSYGIIGDEFKYFRIKRPAPTFDDLFFTLYDLAVKATKEGKLYFSFLSSEQISFSTDNGEKGKINILKGSCDHKVQEAIDFINSLYTETFVIEKVDDIVKVRPQAEGVLANGNNFKVKSLEKCTVRGKGLIVEYNRNEKRFNTRLYIDELKCATITQKRS